MRIDSLYLVDIYTTEKPYQTFFTDCSWQTKENIVGALSPQRLQSPIPVLEYRFDIKLAVGSSRNQL